MEPKQPIPTPSPEAPELTDEEIRRFAETGAVEPPSPVNDLTFSLSSRGGETQNSLASSITKALSFNKKLFVLQNTLISSEQAERFLVQAVTMGDSIDIQQTMTEAAIDTLDMKIRCDPSLKVLNKSEVPLWRTKLSRLQIARLVSQYFGKRHDEKKTLAEVFSKVKFQYCIDNEDHEIPMMADYKDVIKEYTRTVGEIVHTSIVHTFPPTSVKTTASASGWPGPSNTVASAFTSSTSDLVLQGSERRAYNSDPAECQFCGFAN